MEADAHRLPSGIAKEVNSKGKIFSKQSTTSASSEHSPGRVDLLPAPLLGQDEPMAGYPHPSPYDAGAPTYLPAPANHQFPYSYPASAILPSQFDDVRNQGYKYHPTHYNGYGNYLSAHARPSPYPSKPSKLHQDSLHNSTPSTYAEYNESFPYSGTFDGR